MSISYKGIHVPKKEHQDKHGFHEKTVLYDSRVIPSTVLELKIRTAVEG